MRSCSARKCSRKRISCGWQLIQNPHRWWLPETASAALPTEADDVLAGKAESGGTSSSRYPIP
eukprot:3042509-Amphidinium_carterae.1